MKEWIGADRLINASLFLKDVSKLDETRERLRIAYPDLMSAMRES